MTVRRATAGSFGRTACGSSRKPAGRPCRTTASARSSICEVTTSSATTCPATLARGSRAQRAQPENRGHDRQPEVDHPVGDDCRDGRGQWGAGPKEGKGQQRLDRAGAGEWQRSPSERITRRVADQERRDRRKVALVGAKAEGEAGDVAEPVNGRPDRPGEVLQLDEELSDDVDRVKPLREVVAPTLLSAEPVAKP